MLDYNRLPQPTGPGNGAIVCRIGARRPGCFAVTAAGNYPDASGRQVKVTAPVMEAIHNGETIYIVVFENVPAGHYTVYSPYGSNQYVRVDAGQTTYCG